MFGPRLTMLCGPRVIGGRFLLSLRWRPVRVRVTGSAERRPSPPGTQSRNVAQQAAEERGRSAEEARPGRRRRPLRLRLLLAPARLVAQAVLGGGDGGAGVLVGSEDDGAREDVLGEVRRKRHAFGQWRSGLQVGRRLLLV